MLRQPSSECLYYEREYAFTFLPNIIKLEVMSTDQYDHRMFVKGILKHNANIWCQLILPYKSYLKLVVLENTRKVYIY